MRLFGIPSDQIARLAYPPKAGLASGPGAETKFAALAFERSGPGRLDQHALAAQI
jgi:hypothetical protein